MRKELGFFTHYDTNNVNGVSYVTLKGMVIKGDATFKEYMRQSKKLYIAYIEDRVLYVSWYMFLSGSDIPVLVATNYMVDCKE
jgi:hypothetical protein